LNLRASHLKIDRIVLSFIVLLFFVGCAADQQNTQKDPFFEKWNTLAETSQGHSPSAVPKKIDMSALKGEKALKDTITDRPSKKLPNRPINLTMRQADLRSVLRAMAKAVNYNLLVKSDLKAEVSVDFRSVPWDQAFTGLLKTHNLTYTWEGDVIRIRTMGDIEQELKQKVQMRDILEVEPLMDPVVIKIDYADPKKLVDTLKGFLTKDKTGARGSVVYDEHSNALIISATAQDLQRMLPIIEKLDKPTPQVLIKANIVETTKSTARDLGVMWGGMYKGPMGNKNIFVTPGGSYGTGDPITGAYSAAQSKGIGGQGFASNFPIAGFDTKAAGGSLGLIYGIIGESLLEIQLQALQSENKLNILSSPSITTLDNQKAFTENGEKVPYTTIERDSTGTSTPTTKFEDVVLRLEITPHVIDGKNLKMTISVKKDEVDMTRTSQLGDPYIIKKKTETVLIVRDGETIVISGLTKQRILGGNSGWPWLKDIPGLGYLFKTENKGEDMEEVLIFITPHILQLARADQK